MRAACFDRKHKSEHRYPFTYFISADTAEKAACQDQNIRSPDRQITLQNIKPAQNDP